MEGKPAMVEASEKVTTDLKDARADAQADIKTDAPLPGSEEKG